MFNIDPIGITKFRKKMGWTQDDLAQQLGCSKKTVSKWENGISYPTTFYLSMLKQIIEKNTKSIELSIEEKIDKELERAVEKFPLWPTDPLHAVAVLNEEVGELNQAVLDACYDPQGDDIKKVKAEAIQVAAMAKRFLLSIDKYSFHKGEQHIQE